MKKSDTFFELLCLNDKNKIHDFIISNGKGPKPVCPITFMSDEEKSSFSKFNEAVLV